jgi:hypothetical protein
MKARHKLMLLTVAAVLLAACKKSGNTNAPAPTPQLKYLTQEIMVQGTSTLTTNYTYDDKKRLSTVKRGNSTTTYTYNGDNLFSVEQITTNGANVIRNVSETTYTDGKLQTLSLKTYSNGALRLESLLNFVYNGDKLTEAHTDNGYIYFYYYDNNNNVVKMQYDSVTVTRNYDNKKSRFANLPPALKSIGYQINQPDFFSANNIITDNNTAGDLTTYTYNYDADGYPTGATVVHNKFTYLNAKYTYTYTEL